MPDRATIEAAHPRCFAVATRQGIVLACGRQLEWIHKRSTWACPEHGPRITAAELVRSQGASPESAGSV